MLECRGEIMEDLISVIIPVYNVEKYLSRCIDSIIQQTYSNIEIILVNDGSTDSSGRICDFYKEKDQRIKVIHKKNGGLSDARNKGIEIASGSYIVFIDSDDYVKDSYLMKMYTAISNSKADLVICNFEFVDERENAIRKRESPISDMKLTGREIEYKICEKNGDYFVVAWNKMYKKSLWRNLRFPLGKINEDEFVICKILEKCNKVITLKEKLYFYVQRENSIMQKKYSIKRLDVLDAYLERIDFYFEKDLDVLANKTISTFFGILVNAYENIDLKNKNDREYIDDKKEQILDALFKHKQKFSKKNRIKYFVCKKSIGLYKKLRNIGKLLHGKQ